MRAATRGVVWSVLAGGTSKALAVASMVVLARLLDREEFGVAAYALTFTTVLELLRGLGIGQALIFFPGDERRSQTAFWILLANAGLLAVLVVAAAPLLAAFFRDPRAAGVILPLALYFPALALGQVQDVQLRKELRFGLRFAPELARSVAKAVVGVGLALLGWSYWSIVSAQVAGAVAFSAALWVLVPWRPRLVFDRDEARRLLGYGRHLVVVAVLVVIAQRADHLVVGRFLGPEALGVYAIAFTIPALVFQASAGLSQVLFPAYALLERDRARLRSAALRTLRLAAAAFVPLGVGLGLCAEPLVLVGFGAQWRDAAAVLPWMGAWTVLAALTQHFADVYKALGQPRILAWLQATTAIVLVPGLVWAGARAGTLLAVVAVLIAARALRFALDLVMAWRLVDLRPGAALQSIAPSLLAAAAMAAAVIGIDRATTMLPEAARLASMVAGGAATYLVAVAAIDRGLPGEVRALAVAAFARRGAGAGATSPAAAASAAGDAAAVPLEADR
jgi:PST family polysaccharide transporter